MKAYWFHVGSLWDPGTTSGSRRRAGDVPDKFFEGTDNPVSVLSNAVSWSWTLGPEGFTRHKRSKHPPLMPPRQETALLMQI